MPSFLNPLQKTMFCEDARGCASMLKNIRKPSYVSEYRITLLASPTKMENAKKPLQVKTVDNWRSRWRTFDTLLRVVTTDQENGNFLSSKGLHIREEISSDN